MEKVGGIGEFKFNLPMCQYANVPMRGKTPPIGTLKKLIYKTNLEPILIKLEPLILLVTVIPLRDII